MRATSDSKFSASMSSMSKVTATMKSGFGATGAKKKDVDSDLELEDYNEMIEKMELDDVLDSVRKQLKKAEAHKQNFLT